MKILIPTLHRSIASAIVSLRINARSRCARQRSWQHSLKHSVRSRKVCPDEIALTAKSMSRNGALL
eukprot:4044967-Pyramimonas_sp.AAC.1